MSSETWIKQLINQGRNFLAKPGNSAFVRSFVKSAVLVSGLMALTVYLVDPYDHLPISLPLDRAPLAHNQRFSYPALARATEFDSAIVGTSMTRMLQPERINPQLDARFVNLSMNVATAWEQQQLLDLFLRNRIQPKYIILGVGLDLSRFSSVSLNWINPIKENYYGTRPHRRIQA